MIKKWFNSQTIRKFIAFIFLISLFFIFPSTRAFADDFLSLFRVQQVVVVPIDYIDGTSVNPFGIALNRLISSSTIITDEVHPPIVVNNLTEANVVIGFEARLPKVLVPAQLIVFDETSFTMVIDNLKAQSIFDMAGRSDLQLPPEMDGAEIFVDVPFAVRADFGNCLIPHAISECAVFTQLPSPTANFPDDLDIKQLVKIGFEFSGMNSEEADILTSTFDWATTLILPIPRDATSEDVIVDGVIGKLIQEPINARKYILIWIRNDIVYFISGSGDITLGFEIANTLP